ncbi:MAG TPA: S8 family serine peptidase [Solirubrobacterales bacterium]|nr:S8 family serine peptidase [Solirubrobacterales bacterium]
MPLTRRCRDVFQRLGLAVGAIVANLVLAASATAAAPVEGVGAVSRGAVAPGEAIVRFEPRTSKVERGVARRGAGVEFEQSLLIPRAELVEVEGSVAAAVRRLEHQPDVAFAQPNYRYRALAVAAPDDPRFLSGELWGLSDPALTDPGVSALEAWEDPAGAGEPKGAGEVIAVLDTGVDLTHPDLEANLWSNPGELMIGGFDEDGNGFVDDLHGYDFVDADGDPDDYEFHGTHVAGTAAAVADNAEGIAGVAPAAEIMAVRVLDGDGRGFSDDIAEGIAYAATEGADTINLSLGGPAGVGDSLVSTAIEEAAAEDAVVVAAAGNEGANNDLEPHTPCALPNTNLICVAALNRTGGLSSFSNFGAKTVDIAAPGGGDVPGGGIVSAEADYGAPLFADDFEGGFGTTWATATSPGGIPWALESEGGNDLATDSLAADYAPEAVSALFTPDVLNLTGERGCRVRFETRYETEEFFDAFQAGAFSEGPTTFDLREFDGTSPGYPTDLSFEEASISDLGGENDVRLVFRIESDVDEQGDGAYVDDVELVCRDDQYDAGNYVRFSGTSMATPHVSGVVALVRAAAPDLSAPEAIEAVLEGASAIPVPSASRRTATEGIADACQAIAVALNNADPLAECPGSSENAPLSQAAPPGQAPDASPGAAPPAGTPPPAVADRRRPQTFFRKRPSRVIRTRAKRTKVVFRLAADEPGATFSCRIDGAPFRRCPARLVRRFRPGAHVLRVVARDAAGNVDRTPAVLRFRVVRRGR